MMNTHIHGNGQSPMPYRRYSSLLNLITPWRTTTKIIMQPESTRAYAHTLSWLTKTLASVAEAVPRRNIDTPTRKVAGMRRTGEEEGERGKVRDGGGRGGMEGGIDGGEIEEEWVGEVVEGEM